MDRAVVITSFGTSVPEARISITAVEEALEGAALGCRCLRAFTSPTIRKVLAGRGEVVPSLTEALKELQRDGVRQVVVQPTHLLYGIEYDKLKAEAEALAGGFASLLVGRPLLAHTGDIRRSALELSRSHPAKKGEAIVYMGHGTEHFANAAYPALQTALRLAGREDIYIGTVEGWPGLSDILRQLGENGPCRVKLLPLMLVAGDHARNDMAGEWKGALEQAGHKVDCSFIGLGTFSWVQEMYKERLLDVLCPDPAAKEDGRPPVR